MSMYRGVQFTVTCHLVQTQGAVPTLYLNFSFYAQFSRADPSQVPGVGWHWAGWDVAVELTLVLRGESQRTRVLRLHPPSPSRKVNRAKQKNRLEIEPGNKEGLISFVSAQGFFFFSCCSYAFSLPLSAEGHASIPPPRVDSAGNALGRHHVLQENVVYKYSGALCYKETFYQRAPN